MRTKLTNYHKYAVYEKVACTFLHAFCT